MIYVHEPLYQLSAQAGRAKALFAAFATWLLGFATWEVMYFAYRTSPVPLLSPGLPGPNAFVSVLIGDCLALPLINALIVSFYSVAEATDSGSKPDDSKDDKISIGNKLTVGIRWHLFFAAACALLAGVAIYASWFADGKVDWTIPAPGKPNFAGVYHGVFLVIEVYFLTSFMLGAIRIYRWLTSLQRNATLTSDKQQAYARTVRSLTWLLGAICMAANIFAASLRVDVGQGIIPLSTYDATVGVLLIVSLTAIVGMLIGPYRVARSPLRPDLQAIFPLLIAAVAAGIQWWLLR